MSATKGTFENLGSNYRHDHIHAIIWLDEKQETCTESPYFCSKDELKEWIAENKDQVKHGYLIWSANADW